MKLAEKYRLFIIEDATESLGAFYDSRATGTFGNFGCFSFNGNKIITTGGGGMLVGNIKNLKHVKYLVNQARDEGDSYYHSEIGFNYRLTNIGAALGLAQIKKLKKFLKIRKSFNSIYRSELKDLPGVIFQEEHEKAKSSWWFSCIFFEKCRDVSEIREKLKQHGVPTRRIFVPLTMLPPYKKYGNSTYKNALILYKQGLCLPSSTLNSEVDIKYVCRTIKKLC